jgi:hypothetical protein
VLSISKQCVCWVYISTNFLNPGIEVFLFFSGLIGFGYFPNLNQNSSYEFSKFSAYLKRINTKG